MVVVAPALVTPVADAETAALLELISELRRNRASATAAEGLRPCGGEDLTATRPSLDFSGL